MSKILILPDIHNRHEKAEQIIKSVKPDQTILLGDYWDDFNDTPQDIAETAEWFHWSINQKNRIHICGNHDSHYWFKDNTFLRCSGYEQYKAISINDFVKKEDWEKLVFYYVLDNQWLLSHAGVSPYWINPHKFNSAEVNQFSLDFIVKRLKNETNEAKKKFYLNKIHWFGMPGYTRSNNSPYYGGITWLDWNGEFHPIRGVHQIVGHTPNNQITWNIVKEKDTSPLWKLSIEEIENPILTDENSYNLCLDSHPGSKYYAIYENKQLTIHLTYSECSPTLKG